MAKTSWKPGWWKDDTHGSAWERAKEAMRRDWEQTKKDLHLPGGHELNQNVGDTVKQATGTQPLPPIDAANPAKVVGDWSDVELPMGYGYGARHQYGSTHASWNEDLESKLRDEWETSRDAARRGWDDVRSHVRRGYEWGSSSRR